MTELKTFSKNDPEFIPYLLGSFSKNERALPVQSLNVTTETEKVTFQIVPAGEIRTPSFFPKWALILKLNNFILVFLPIFLILSKCTLDDVVFDPILALLSGFGAFSLHAAVNLRNDYLDHLSGLDRIYSESGKAIQKGWLTAAEAKKLSNIFIGIGFLLGTPSVFFYPELLLVIAVLLVMGFTGIQSYRFGLKYRLWTEVTAFFLLGPFLAVGYQMSIGAGFDLETIFLGFITGWFAVFILHLKNFNQIMVSNQAGFVNSITILGFEKSKYLILFWWVGLILSLFLYHFIYAMSEWLAAFSVAAVGLSFFVFRSVRKIQSPVASNFKTMLMNLHRLVVILMLLWVIEFVTLIAVIELGQV